MEAYKNDLSIDREVSWFFIIGATRLAAGITSLLHFNEKSENQTFFYMYYFKQRIFFLRASKFRFVCVKVPGES